jgi:hypothetical protein
MDPPPEPLLLLTPRDPSWSAVPPPRTVASLKRYRSIQDRRTGPHNPVQFLLESVPSGGPGYYNIPRSKEELMALSPVWHFENQADLRGRGEFPVHIRSPCSESSGGIFVYSRKTVPSSCPSHNRTAREPSSNASAHSRASRAPHTRASFSSP